MIIGYNISKSPNLELAMNMMKSCKFDISDSILHTDQGNQYKSKEYIAYCNTNNIIRSMSRKGNCADNTESERIFSIFERDFYERNKNLSSKKFIKKLDKFIH